MAGRILGDRYELGPVVGRGGMATVYRARDRVLHREVAVKVLQPQLARDQEFIERFRREARAAAGLSHPNIVGVHDHGSDGSDHFIVMEFVEGRTLAEVLDEEGALETGRAIAIATDVAAALSAAHERGLVHRDVKPANILLTDRGRVMVTDFGIARAATSQGLTMTGTVLGTASYLSPEQARGEPVDERSDVYSLGCVLYEMLTGEPPFAADSPVAVAALHVNADPPRPSAHQPGV
ncbi:MAG TPA: protein kinase, partial [Actinomycetota bacterium]|nr:protein kinase [Actinomycetota bacterium]